MEIAKERAMTLPDIISFDLINTSHLFNGALPAQDDTSKLVGEIVEGLVEIFEWDRQSNLICHVVVDFM